MRSVLAMVLFSTVACGGSDGKFPPRREVARDIATAACEREVACGGTPDAYFDACVEMAVDSICTSVDCSTDTVATANEINDLIECLNALACDASGCDLLI